MNWKKPTNTEHPPFKTIVIGLQLPNKVELVKLDRIDESGPVFHAARERGMLNDFAEIFAIAKNTTDARLRETVKIDFYAEIVLPAKENTGDTKEEKSSDAPLNS